MTSEEIISGIESGELDKLRNTLEAQKMLSFISDSFSSSGTNTASTDFTKKDADQYNPKQHIVHDKSKRADKVINGDEGRAEAIIPVTRLSIPEQKKIVLLAASFLGCPELVATTETEIEEQLLSVIETIGEDNKLEYKFMDIMKRTMSERECAELWYTQEAEDDFWAGTPMDGAKKKLRMRLLSPALGDTLYPAYDSYGDMVAFGRYYEITEINENGKSEKVKHFDIYTKETFYFAVKKEAETTWSFIIPKTEDGNTDAAVKGFKNIIGKIPVIYYSQPATEWSDVQEMIDRLEKKISNHADTNDYYDSPIVKAKGEVEGFSDKGESGKVLKMTEGADAEYLTYDSLPESMKMEMDNLKEFINKYTHTPDISFNNVKGLGVFSGIALKMFFMDAHLKASDKEELFGQAVQRRINYLKTAIAVISPKFKPAVRLVIRPQFEYFLPKDVDGEVQTLVTAYSAGIISLETALKLNPLVEDAVKEMELIKADKAATPPPTPPDNSGGGVVDSLGKIPLALQQLSLAATRAQDAGDIALASRLNSKMDEILKTI